MDAPVTVTKRQLAAAFTEWDKRRQAEPGNFVPLPNTPEDSDEYGEESAGYMLEILAELNQG